MNIVLTTANARYTHCAFGLRCLAAALKSHGYDTVIHEFTIHHSPFEIAESLLAQKPQVIGFGVYIWNVGLMAHLAQIIRSVSPETILILGGPEMSGSSGDTPFLDTADYIITGEGEDSLSELIAHIEAGRRPVSRIIQSKPPSLERLASTYDYYSDEDIAHRIIYVESSRGCPYRCTFCLSSLDAGVRYFPLPQFLASMDMLLEKGVRLFKFTDRTFNLDDERVLEILKFFLRHDVSNMQVHLEIMPDRLSDAVREVMAAFPPGTLHLELGIQSFNPETLRRIKRRQHIEQTMDTIALLRMHTGAVLHADLIIGLPGDSEEDVATGFDALVKMKVQELQIGLLKRLKGTPMAADADTELLFDSNPPYEVLQTSRFSFAAIQKLKRFSRYFDMYYNHGNFPESLNLLWQDSTSPFASFAGFADFIWEKEQRTYGLPLARLAEHLFAFSCEIKGCDRFSTGQRIEKDFRRLSGRLDKLNFLC